ncbi:hypothetical protein F5Y13DRAFT_196679 [Hypoxylon sp. FL1857]|nr:hypothetical protein F5Y13DRAFT_196679 [Hypoxylon sp. FL1857]
MGVFLSRQFGKLTTNDELDNQAIRVHLLQTGFEFSWPFLPREVEENVVEALGLRESSPRQEERMRALLIEIFRVDSLKVRCFVLALRVARQESSDFPYSWFFGLLAKKIADGGIEGGGFFKNSLLRFFLGLENPGRLTVLSGNTVSYLMYVYMNARKRFVDSHQPDVSGVRGSRNTGMSYERLVQNMEVAVDVSAEDESLIEAVDQWIIQAERAYKLLKRRAALA